MNITTDVTSLQEKKGIKHKIITFILHFVKRVENIIFLNYNKNSSTAYKRKE